MMPTDDERREVARRLRGDLEDARSNGYYCSDSETVKYICDILGLRCSRCPHPWAGLEVLADLIEPDTTTDTTKAAPDTTKCDRDALLALADELEQETGSVCGVCMGKTARRIREALGLTMDKSNITWTMESDWSMESDWCLSRTTMSKERYPKQIRVGDLDRQRVYYPINRDALIELAEGLECKADDIIRAAKHAQFSGFGPRMGEAKHDAYEWRCIAHRIREALGEGES